MYQVTVLYDPPADAAAFDRHYDEVHAPLARAIPGLQRYTVSRPGPGADGSPPRYHLVAVLEFADEAAFGAGMGSEQGRATQADLPNFAQAGAMLLTGPGREV